MSNRSKIIKVPQLTLKRARELAMQEFGTAKGLKHEEDMPEGYFRMLLGNLIISIHNDSYLRPEHIIVTVKMVCGYGSCVQLHNSSTLEEDFSAEDVRDMVR